jgi:hypothetical protein
VGFAVAKVVVPDLVNVGSISSLCDVDFACIDEFLEVLFFISFPLGLYWGASAMVKQPGKFTAMARVWAGCCLLHVRGHDAQQPMRSNHYQV